MCLCCQFLGTNLHHEIGLQSSHRAQKLRQTELYHADITPRSGEWLISKLVRNSSWGKRFCWNMHYNFLTWQFNATLTTICWWWDRLHNVKGCLRYFWVILQHSSPLSPLLVWALLTSCSDGASISSLHHHGYPVRAVLNNQFYCPFFPL